MTSLLDPGAGMNQASSGTPSRRGERDVLVLEAVLGR